MTTAGRNPNMQKVFDENRVTIWQGDVRAVLAALPADSVHCCVTSPPYWGLRDYGTGTWDGGDPDCEHSTPRSRGEDIKPGDKQGTSAGSRPNTQQECGKCGAKRIDAQIGLEATPEEYLAAMVEVFRGVKRVLRHDGTLWLNMGDCYASQPNQRGIDDIVGTKQETNRGSRSTPSRSVANLKPKDLVGMPWMLAFALRADGWYLRSDIIWAKPNPMPESVEDRPTKAHEYIFLLTKSPRYFYDADAIRELTGTEAGWDEYQLADGRKMPSGTLQGGVNVGFGAKHDSFTHPNGRNKRSVWEVATQAFPEAHFATFPEALIQPCILAGTSEKGCCAHCGAPWRRIVAPSEEYAKNLGKGYHDHAGDGVEYGLRQKGGGPKSIAADYRTIGWEPTCECKSAILSGGLQVEPAPCTVLDPFFGSGTTALVARKNGCRAIGVELNPAYIEIAKRRLRQSTFEF